MAKSNDTKNTSEDLKKQAEEQQRQVDDQMEREARAEMDRKLAEVENDSSLSDDEKAARREQVQGTEGTPAGLGRRYDPRENASASNTYGKASATRAGGDPVTSPVIGNPGENNPAAGNYDYALAAASGNPAAATAPLASSDLGGDPRRLADPRKGDFKHAVRVKALRKGDYNGIKEAGEEFDNDRNLAPYPEDEKSWFAPVDEGEYRASEKRGVQRREEKQRRAEQEEQERAAIAKLAAGRRG